MNDLDMRQLVRNLGTTTQFAAGSTIFTQGQSGDCAYVVQSGKVELIVGETRVDQCDANDIFGYMSLIDGSARSSSARAIDDVEVTLIDDRRFRYMIDEIPNFSMYVMKAMAQRIRGMAGAI